MNEVTPSKWWHIARVKVSKELLLQALAMPEDTGITNVTYDGRTIEFIVIHPDLPATTSDQKIPEVTPVYRVVGSPPREWLKFSWTKEDQDDG